MKKEKLWYKIGIEDSKQKNSLFQPQQEKINPVENPQQKKQANDDDFMSEILKSGLPTYIQVAERTQNVGKSSETETNMNSNIKLYPSNIYKQNQTRSVLKKTLNSISQMKNFMQNLVEDIERNLLFYKEAQINLGIVIRQQSEKHQEQKEDLRKLYEGKVNKLSEMLNKQKQLRKEEVSKNNQEINEKRKKNIDQEKRIFQLEMLNNQNQLKIAKAEQNKNKNFSYQVQLEEKNQKSMKRILDMQKENMQKDQKILQVEANLKQIKDENIVLQRKINDLDKQIQERLNDEIEKVREESHTIQHQFYLREIEKIDEDVQVIRNKYHQKATELNRRQEINMAKEQQMEKIEKGLVNEREYLQSFERKLIDWERQLNAKSIEIEKQKKSMYSPYRHQYMERYHQSNQSSRNSGRERDLDMVCGRQGRKSSIHFSKCYQNVPQKDRDEGGKQKNQGMFRSLKERKLNTEIDELDTRLKVIQEEMKREIEYLKQID